MKTTPKEYTYWRDEATARLSDGEYSGDFGCEDLLRLIDDADRCAELESRCIALAELVEELRADNG